VSRAEDEDQAEREAGAEGKHSRECRNQKVRHFRFARVGLVALHVSGRFLPFYCCERKVVSMEPKLTSLVPQVEPKESKLRLEPAPWLMAWDCYALAAVALSQVCGFALHGCSGLCLWVQGALRVCSVVL
jgi:hypothetical protein